MIRFFDLFFSSIALIFLFPILLPIVIILKLTGEHYVFYKQIRIGKYGKEFEIIKFATMLFDSPNLPGGLFTTKNDPRLLPLGKFLRKTKINELPQLFNVFIGQMSLVGYRPTVREHYDAYPEDTKKKIFNSVPGLTGLGSIVFRDEEEILHNVKDKDSFHKNIITPYKAALECWYVDNKNVKTYFLLIFVTIIVLLKPKTSIWRQKLEKLPPVPEDLKPFI